LKHVKLFSFCPFSRGSSLTQALAFQPAQAMGRAPQRAAPYHLSPPPCAAPMTGAPASPHGSTVPGARQCWTHREIRLMDGVDGLGDEITAWDLPSKYAVGGYAPGYRHGPVSHCCLGRR